MCNNAKCCNDIVGAAFMQCINHQQVYVAVLGVYLNYLYIVPEREHVCPPTSIQLQLLRTIKMTNSNSLAIICFHAESRLL